jgi:thiamine biosynthesis lipoprotein
MGSQVEAVVPESSADLAERILTALFRTWEALLSRFQPNSALTALNRAAGRWVAVPEVLWQAIQAALDAAKATGGVFDPTVGRYLEALGYDRPFDQISAGSSTGRFSPPPRTNWRQVELDPDARRVKLPPGVQLDLGGIGKGLTVDEALRRLEAAGCVPALVSAGGDLAVRGVPSGLEGWAVGIPSGDVLWLQRGAVATSGPERRRWSQGPWQRHHLIDPKTALPGEPYWRWCTVIAHRGAQADVAATVTWLLGSQAAEFLNAHQMAGILAPQEGPPRWIGLSPTSTRPGRLPHALVV